MCHNCMYLILISCTCMRPSGAWRTGAQWARPETARSGDVTTWYSSLRWTEARPGPPSSVTTPAPRWLHLADQHPHSCNQSRRLVLFLLSKLCPDWNVIPHYFYQTRSMTIATSLISYWTISACSCGTDREEAGTGGQHWCLGNVDISTNLCFLQHHLLGLLQVAYTSCLRPSSLLLYHALHAIQYEMLNCYGLKHQWIFYNCPSQLEIVWKMIFGQVYLEIYGIFRKVI